MCGISIILILKGIMTNNLYVLKSNNPCILLNKNINFNKNETEWKMENPTHRIKDKSKLHRPSYIRLGAVAYFFEVINFI